MRLLGVGSVSRAAARVKARRGGEDWRWTGREETTTTAAAAVAGATRRRGFDGARLVGLGLDGPGEDCALDR